MNMEGQQNIAIESPEKNVFNLCAEIPAKGLEKTVRDPYFRNLT